RSLDAPLTWSRHDALLTWDRDDAALTPVATQHRWSRNAIAVAVLAVLLAFGGGYAITRRAATPRTDAATRTDAAMPSASAADAIDHALTRAANTPVGHGIQVAASAELSANRDSAQAATAARTSTVAAPASLARVSPPADGSMSSPAFASNGSALFFH